MLAGLDDTMRYRLLLNYLRSFEAELRKDDKSLLVRSAFFEAIFTKTGPVPCWVSQRDEGFPPAALHDAITALAPAGQSR
jgi:hypothetical protein